MTHSTKQMATAFVIATAFSINSFGQQSIASADRIVSKTNTELPGDNPMPVAANAKTEASFVALFPNASHAIWSAMGDNYYVSFLNNGKKVNVVFTAKGKMNYCITDCSLSDLPAAFRKIIQKQYAGYSLIKGSEIKTHGDKVYQAILENSSSFTTLKYNRDGLEEAQQVKKQ